MSVHALIRKDLHSRLQPFLRPGGKAGAPCSEGTLIEVCSMCALPEGNGDNYPAFTDPKALCPFLPPESPASVLSVISLQLCCVGFQQSPRRSQPASLSNLSSAVWGPSGLLFELIVLVLVNAPRRCREGSGTQVFHQCAGSPCSWGALGSQLYK